MKISRKRINRILGVICVMLLLIPLTAFAQNRVVVIPLLGGADAKPLKNIVTVAKSNGMFTDPVAAVNSITDATETNPYLVVIGPGEYTVTAPVVMKEWVDITGSGANITRIKGAISAISGGSYSTSAIIKGASHSVLSFLTIVNTGGGEFSIALLNDSASPSVSNVIAKAYGGTGMNVGVCNNSSSLWMIDVIATANGGTVSYGVYNNISSPVMTNVTATATGGVNNRGVGNYSSSPMMTNGTAIASGGSGSNYGFQNNNNSSSAISRSRLEGGTYGLYSDSGITTISQSTIKLGVSSGGTKTCVACDNGSGKYLNRDDCSVIP